ncbi:MAG TPA: dihydrofolate reductase family protein [Dermatophilaceae bacterium]|nr:dihydrofolate reductase family protein [Dermatophilaceae bacterium]
MREIVAGYFASVDGVLESPHVFQLDAFDDGVGAAMDRATAGVDTVLMGRVTYDQWSGYWPTAEDEFKDFINPVTKLVASRTRTRPLDWQNSRLVGGDLLDTVRALKATDGGRIAVSGSLSIARQLAYAGLLDELILVVHPALAGTGRRLTEDGDPPLPLRLADHQVTEKGNVVLTYRLRG